MDTGDGDAPAMSIGKMCEELRSGNHLYMFERNEIAAKLESLIKQVHDWHCTAKYTPAVSGKSWYAGQDHSQWDRCRRTYIEGDTNHE